MSFTHDRVLDIATTPSLSRAADIYELIHALKLKDIVHKFGRDKRLMAVDVGGSWRQKVDELAKGQSYMSVDAFKDEAELIAYERESERMRVQRERYLKRMEDAERFAEIAQQAGVEEHLIESGVLA